MEITQPLKETTQLPVLDFELFFEISADLLCIAGYDGYFKKINPAVSKLLGYTQEELFARPIYNFIYNEDKQLTAAHREKLIKAQPLLNFENRYVTKTGEIVWLSWTSIPVEKHQMVYAIAKNITHKKQQEADRNLIITNLTEINKNLKLLTYKTSHDLRSPVNNLLGVFNLLDTCIIDDERTMQFIGMLKSATGTLQDTLDKYVAVLKQNANIQLEELNLNVVLRKVLASVSTLIINSKTTITCNFTQLENIYFNKAYLESIFLNLIGNAIKYARPGIAPVINIRTEQTDKGKKLIFADNGLGFDMEKAGDKVFGFRQTFHKNQDSQGIGLYLVYNHITNLGGKISLDSQLNEGATFTITFSE